MKNFPTPQYRKPARWWRWKCKTLRQQTPPPGKTFDNKCATLGGLWSCHPFISARFPFLLKKGEEKKEILIAFLFALPDGKESTILVTNRWNRHRFSRIFWNNHEISTSHCFPPWNVPSPSPMLSHAYFEALRPLWYPNQHWGRGNRHKCFKIFDEYCRSGYHDRNQPTVVCGRFPGSHGYSVCKRGLHVQDPSFSSWGYFGFEPSRMLVFFFSFEVISFLYLLVDLIALSIYRICIVIMK